jgi:cholestenol delta-isomerase
MADAVINTVESLANNVSHPYYPIGAHIAGYVANQSSVSALLGAFFGACVILFSSASFIVTRIQPTLSRIELLTIMWFLLSGSIHIIFEGYYVANATTLASKQTVLGQMWKEYAFSDSRYLTQNAQVFCLEAITVLVWGPLCVLVAALITTRSAWRYPLQIVVSLGQLYGDALYYATSYFDHQIYGISYSRPEAFYFWFYFVTMNAIWIVGPAGEYSAAVYLRDDWLIPAKVLICQASVKSATAIASMNRLENGKKSQ